MFIAFIIHSRCRVAVPCKSQEAETELKPGALKSPGLKIQPQSSRPSTVHTEGIASSTEYETPYQTTNRPDSIVSNYVDTKFYEDSSPDIIYNNSDEE